MLCLIVTYHCENISEVRKQEFLHFFKKVKITLIIGIIIAISTKILNPFVPSECYF